MRGQKYFGLECFFTFHCHLKIEVNAAVMVMDTLRVYLSKLGIVIFIKKPSLCDQNTLCLLCLRGSSSKFLTTSPDFEHCALYGNLLLLVNFIIITSRLRHGHTECKMLVGTFYSSKNPNHQLVTFLT